MHTVQRARSIPDCGCLSRDVVDLGVGIPELAEHIPRVLPEAGRGQTEAVAW